MRLAIPIILVTLLPACTWVELSEGGKAVTVVSSVPETCERLGQTRTSIKADVANIDRNREKVSQELATLARNAAANMGGDTITPESEPSENGEQVFGIYRCGTQ